MSLVKMLSGVIWVDGNVKKHFMEPDKSVKAGTAVAVVGVMQSEKSSSIFFICVDSDGRSFAVPINVIRITVDKELRECIAEAELHKP